MNSWWLRNTDVVNQIIDLTFVIIKTTREFSFEEGEVHTNVVFFFNLPADVLILVVANTIGADPVTINQIPSVGAVHPCSNIRVETLITGFSVSCSELQIIKHIQILDKRFFRSSPAQRQSREGTPTVAR